MAKHRYRGFALESQRFTTNEEPNLYLKEQTLYEQFSIQMVTIETYTDRNERKVLKCTKVQINAQMWAITDISRIPKLRSCTWNFAYATALKLQEVVRAKLLKGKENRIQLHSATTSADVNHPGYINVSILIQFG